VIVMNKGTDRILVTGATGSQGGTTARELLAAGYKVRTMTRKPDSPKARELAKLGAEVVAGDLDDAASLERAAAGMWGVFALQNTWEAGVPKEEEQGLRLAEIARKTNVQHLVYASVASAHRETGIPHFDNKSRIEDRVRALGFPSYVIVRPVFFMENFLGPWFLPSIQAGKLPMGIQPDTMLQMIAVKDIGKYHKWAFDKHEELNRREIDIAGDEMTMPEAAKVISQATSHEVQFVPVPIEEVRKGSADYAIMLEWFDEVGYNADITKMAQESGIRPTRFAEWAATANWVPSVAAR
jgi:uncharacterized protein YbjT (DUF2867 family)